MSCRAKFPPMEERQGTKCKLTFFFPSDQNNGQNRKKGVQVRERQGTPKHVKNRKRSNPFIPNTKALLNCHTFAFRASSSGQITMCF